MKDNLQVYLENECKTQQWLRHHLNKEITVPKTINKLCVSSIRQLESLNKKHETYNRNNSLGGCVDCP